MVAVNLKLVVNRRETILEHLKEKTAKVFKVVKERQNKKMIRNSEELFKELIAKN